MHDKILNVFKSNVTNREYNVKNHTGEILTCHSQNIIYLLTCLGCGVQYVGETIYPFHKRNNQHRTEMNSHFSFHLETSCKNYSYSYQIIEKLPGTGYSRGHTPVHRGSLKNFWISFEKYSLMFLVCRNDRRCFWKIPQSA